MIQWDKMMMIGKIYTNWFKNDVTYSIGMVITIKKIGDLLKLLTTPHNVKLGIESQVSKFNCIFAKKCKGYIGPCNLKYTHTWCTMHTFNLDWLINKYNLILP